MTPEQRAKLEAHRLKLIDVLIIEADVTTFAPTDTREGRGDRVWQKSNAIKTTNLIMLIEGLIGLRGAGSGSIPAPRDGDDEADTAGASAGAADVERLIREAGAKVSRIAAEKKKPGGKRL